MPLDKWMDGFNYDPSTFNASQFKEAVLREYNADRELWDAKISSLTDDASSKDTTIKELKTQAWDWMMKAGTPIPEKNASGSQVPPVTEEDPNEPELQGIDSFFTKKE